MRCFLRLKISDLAGIVEVPLVHVPMRQKFEDQFCEVIRSTAVLLTGSKGGILSHINEKPQIIYSTDQGIEVFLSLPLVD